MKLLKISYKKGNEIINKVLRVLVDDDIEIDEVRQIVYENILLDLGISRFEWELDNESEDK